MRRKDREVTDISKIEQIINACDCCRLGFSDEDGVYIVPLNFGYANGTFYFHGASEGRKIDLIHKTGTAGFELDTGHKLTQGETPCTFSFEFQSVIGQGCVSIVEDIEEKKEGLRLILKHYSERDDFLYTNEMAASVTVFKLKAEIMTCKEHL
jgi:nitroimidazol reductase NimA-like FMN-containing flavoprotein (pyridoxamine 5'-phosphate oxidase superfamily)